MQYKEQIKHPNWQKKRLKILERDNWKCCVCKRDDLNLHVHHLYYRPKFLIWEYEDESLVTLCDKHHEIITNELPKLAGIIAFRILTNDLIL